MKPSGPLKRTGPPKRKTPLKRGKILAPSTPSSKRLPPAAPSSLPNASKKRAAQNRQYSKDRVPFLDANPICAAQLSEDGCTCSGRATQVHHMKGRVGDLLLDQRFWLPICASCHQYVTEHSKLAYEVGLSLHRNATTEENNDG